MTKPLTFPSLSINGTDGQELLDALQAAASALQKARTALAATTPNARDYPKPGSFEQARDEFAARCVAIVQVRHEVEELAMNVVDQYTGLQARRRGGR